MNKRTFDQLDTLERGARYETRPGRDEYHNSSMEYSAYDGNEARYGQERDVPHAYQQSHANFIDQPMVLDSFGE